MLRWRRIYFCRRSSLPRGAPEAEKEKNISNSQNYPRQTLSVLPPCRECGVKWVKEQLDEQPHGLDRDAPSRKVPPTPSPVNRPPPQFRSRRMFFPGVFCFFGFPQTTVAGARASNGGPPLPALPLGRSFSG